MGVLMSEDRHKETYVYSIRESYLEESGKQNPGKIKQNQTLNKRKH